MHIPSLDYTLNVRFLLALEQSHSIPPSSIVQDAESCGRPCQVYQKQSARLLRKCGCHRRHACLRCTRAPERSGSHLNRKAMSGMNEGRCFNHWLWHKHGQLTWIGFKHIIDLRRVSKKPSLHLLFISFWCHICSTRCLPLFQDEPSPRDLSGSNLK